MPSEVLSAPGDVGEASDAGSFITGQSFAVDGGFTAGGRWFTPDR